MIFISSDSFQIVIIYEPIVKVYKNRALNSLTTGLDYMKYINQREQ